MLKTFSGEIQYMGWPRKDELNTSCPAEAIFSRVRVKLPAKNVQDLIREFLKSA